MFWAEHYAFLILLSLNIFSFGWRYFLFHGTTLAKNRMPIKNFIMFLSESMLLWLTYTTSNLR